MPSALELKKEAFEELRYVMTQITETRADMDKLQRQLDELLALKEDLYEEVYGKQ